MMWLDHPSTSALIALFALVLPSSFGPSGDTWRLHVRLPLTMPATAAGAPAGPLQKGPA